MVGVEIRKWDFEKNKMETRIYLPSIGLNPAILRLKPKEAVLFHVNGNKKKRIGTIFNGLITLKTRNVTIVETENELEIYVHF